MKGSRSTLGAPKLGIAVGAVIVGHWLTYIVLRPEHHERASLLASTGHGYLAAALEMTWLIALVAAAAVFLSRLGRQGTTLGHRSLTARLGAFQLSAFLLMEVSERAIAGSFEGLLAVAVVGAWVQLLVATAAAWLLRRLELAADAVSSVLGRGASTGVGRATSLIHPVAADHRGAPAFAATGIRGPPPRG